MKKKILLTGHKGLLGSKIFKNLSSIYDFDLLDLKSGFDLSDEKKIDNYFKKNKNYYAVIMAHAYNPQKNKSSNNPLKINSDEVRKYMETNLITCFNICRYYILNNKKGRIINISSIYGVVSPNHKLYGNSFKHIGYALSKSSIIMLTKYLANLYSPNFLINCLVIGGIYNSKINKKFIKKYEDNVPIKRMMYADEVIPLLNFLLDKKNTYTSGSSIVSYGGWTSI